MRLIDADALKTDLQKFFPNDCLEGITSRTLFAQILTDIDNAPTVEYPFYQEAYQTGYEEGKNERPHGEWVEWDDEKWGGTTVYCPFCGATPHKQYKNFCPNCGADMRGEENE